MSELNILFTPSDYDTKLVFQTWLHLVRTDFRQHLETCIDPAPLSLSPLILTRLSNLGDRPPLSSKYYENCHIEANFHVVSQSTSQDSQFDRFLILSISLPIVEQPDINPDRIWTEQWPSCYHYENREDGTRNRLRGSIWATHKLKPASSKATPLLLDTITLPTPTELLRFRISHHEGDPWSDPAHFAIDDYGYVSINKNVSFQLDQSQQLINTRLDETIDVATGGFIPDITVLGRPVQPRDINYPGSRFFTNTNNYPYDTEPSARARLSQPPWIPNTPRTPLNQIPRRRTVEQQRTIDEIQNGDTSERAATHQPLLNGQQAPAPPPAAETQVSDPPPADELTLNNDALANSAVTSEQNISVGSLSPDSSHLSTEQGSSLGAGALSGTLPPLESSPLRARATPDQEDELPGGSEDNHRFLRSEDKAPEQTPIFMSFVHSFVEFYNQEKTAFQGSNSALHPLFTLDSETSKFIVHEEQMTNRNLNAMKELMVESKKKGSVFLDKDNKNMKTILKKYAK